MPYILRNAEGMPVAWAKNLNWDIFYQVPDDLSERYLKRLKMTREAPTREYLDRLIFAHQKTIPFENLNTMDFNEPVSLEPSKIAEKFLDRNRGGYCFELNGLFSLLLRSLGFDAWMCPCRQLRHKESYPVPIAHCGVLVYLDGKELFCDVGYGGPAPRGSLQLTAEGEQTVRGERFVFQKAPLTAYSDQFKCEQPGWYTLTRLRTEKPDMKLIQVAPLQCYILDFYGASMSRSMGDSAFPVRHVAVLTEDGFVDLMGNTLEIKAGGTRSVQTVEDAEIPDVLLRWFAMDCAELYQK